MWEAWGWETSRVRCGDVWNFGLVISQPLIKTCTRTLTFYRILDKMKELPESQKIMICKLLLVNPACAVRHSRMKALFSAWIKNMPLSPRFFSEGRGASVHRLLRSTMAKRLSNLTVLNSHKEIENRQICLADVANKFAARIYNWERNFDIYIKSLLPPSPLPSKNCSASPDLWALTGR